MSVMDPVLAIVIGVACAAAGGEFFVRGIVGLAQWARIAPGIVAATVAAFATSSPELSVALESGLAGHPQIALGNTIGSNMVNIALILGIMLSSARMVVPREAMRRDLPVALLVPLLLALSLLDGVLSRGEGLAMLAVFLAWMVRAALVAYRERQEAALPRSHPPVLMILAMCVAGLLLLAGAGHFIVQGSTAIARHFGLSEFLIGATLVALGTTTPELVTAIVARLRRREDIGLGTLLGSNIFNGIFIVPLAATLHPITVSLVDALPALLFGVAALLLVYPPASGVLDRRRGIALLLLYATYVLTHVLLT